MNSLPSSPSVALVGRQNVGKSSIFNRLTRTKSALVADFPGLTRDYRVGHCSIRNQILNIIDTGGFSKNSKDFLSDKVNEKTLQLINLVNYVILVVDAKEGLTHSDELIFKQILKLNVNFSIFLNKSENRSSNELVYEFSELTIKPFYIVSALHNIGIHEAIEDVLLKTSFNSPQPIQVEKDYYKVIFFGKPNVGKSTLLNRILGYERVIESDQPGTTREDLEAEIIRNNITYKLVDTAGVRRKSKVKDGIEKLSALRTIHTLDKSHIIILILDASENLSFQDLRLFSNISKSNVPFLIVATKIDKISNESKLKFKQEIERKIRFQSLRPIIFLSGKKGLGISKLFKALESLAGSLEKKVKTSEINNLLFDAIEKHPPPMIRNRRPKPRYAHIIKVPNVKIVIYGNQVEILPEDYKRYLSNYFREHLQLHNHPLSLIFKGKENPFSNKKNILSNRQIQKRKRLLRYTKKKRKQPN